MTQVEMLTDAAEAAAEAALLQDFFSVNSEGPVPIPFDTDVMLVGPFCIEGPSVFKFELSATVGTSEVEGISDVAVVLMIDSIPVASARSDDSEAPSSLSLIYRGDIAAESQVVVMVRGSFDPLVIDTNELQYGYKLYGPAYTLLAELDTSCIVPPA